MLNLKSSNKMKRSVEQTTKPIATTNVHHKKPIGNNFHEVIAENAGASSCDVVAVNAIGELHRRRIPKMLTKKLERIV
jgi:hypothetical protein